MSRTKYDAPEVTLFVKTAQHSTEGENLYSNLDQGMQVHQERTGFSQGARRVQRGHQRKSSIGKDVEQPKVN